MTRAQKRRLDAYGIVDFYVSIERHLPSEATSWLQNNGNVPAPKRRFSVAGFQSIFEVDGEVRECGFDHLPTSNESSSALVSAHNDQIVRSVASGFASELQAENASAIEDQIENVTSSDIDTEVQDIVVTIASGSKSDLQSENAGVEIRIGNSTNNEIGIQKQINENGIGIKNRETSGPLNFDPFCRKDSRGKLQ